jgi:head-tail adaptor
MLKGIDPGKLDELLTFERPTVSRSSINSPQTTWTVYRQVYGQRIWLPSPEAFEARQETGFDKVQYALRYDANITSLMRFKQNSESETTYFYVRSVDQNRREGSTVITAERRDNQ